MLGFMIMHLHDFFFFFFPLFMNANLIIVSLFVHLLEQNFNFSLKNSANQIERQY